MVPRGTAEADEDDRRHAMSCTHLKYREQQLPVCGNEVRRFTSDTISKRDVSVCMKGRLPCERSYVVGLMTKWFDERLLKYTC